MWIIPNVLALGFGLATIFAYLWGVRADKQWGVPVMVLLLIGAVGFLALPYTPQWQRARQRARMGADPLELIGSHLAADMQEGARVLVLREPGAPEAMPDLSREQAEERGMPTREEAAEELSADIRESLRKGFGYDIELVDAVAVEVEEAIADDWNHYLQDYENEQIDLVVSLDGLPLAHKGDGYALEDLACLDWASVPRIAADMGTQYDPDQLNAYIRDGLLDAAVIVPESASDRMVISPDNLDALPEESPR